MLSYSLEIDDFSSDDYHLLGIHSGLEDYQLAFLLNKYLKISLQKATFELEFDEKTTKKHFSVFEYSNEELDYDLFLLSNKCNVKNESLNFGLFDSVDTIKYLIPEQKNVDFFIKIEGEVDTFFVQQQVDQVRKISQISTTYIIEANTLKSKNFLIF